MKSITNILIVVIELIIMIAIFAGVTPIVLDTLDNLSLEMVNAGEPLGAIFAVSGLGGILWFTFTIITIMSIIFFTIKKTSNK